MSSKENDMARIKDLWTKHHAIILCIALAWLTGILGFILGMLVEIMRRTV